MFDFLGCNSAETDLSSRSDSGFCDKFDAGNEENDEIQTCEKLTETYKETCDIVDKHVDAKESVEKTSPTKDQPSHYQSQFASTLAMFDTQPRVRYIPVCGVRGGRGGR